MKSPSCSSAKFTWVPIHSNVVDQCIAAGLVDELRIHVSPVLVGSGTRLFAAAGAAALVQRDVVVSPRAIHVTYDIVGR